MKNWFLIILVAAASFALGGGVSYVVNTNSNQINTVQQAAVRACRASLAPGGVRFILAQQIKSQIRQSKAFDYSKFFPEVPPKQLSVLLRAQQRRNQMEIHQLLGVDCEKQYRP